MQEHNEDWEGMTPGVGFRWLDLFLLSSFLQSNFSVQQATLELLCWAVSPFHISYVWYLRKQNFYWIVKNSKHANSEGWSPCGLFSVIYWVANYNSQTHFSALSAQCPMLLKSFGFSNLIMCILFLQQDISLSVILVNIISSTHLEDQRTSMTTDVPIFMAHIGHGSP